MTKTGSRNENINFLRNWRNSGFVADFFGEICNFWWTKNGILGGKIWQRSRESIKS